MEGPLAPPRHQRRAVNGHHRHMMDVVTHDDLHHISPPHHGNLPHTNHLLREEPLHINRLHQGRLHLGRRIGPLQLITTRGRWGVQVLLIRSTRTNKSEFHQKYPASTTDAKEKHKTHTSLPGIPGIFLICAQELT